MAVYGRKIVIWIWIWICNTGYSSRIGGIRNISGQPCQDDQDQDEAEDFTSVDGQAQPLDVACVKAQVNDAQTSLHCSVTVAQPTQLSVVITPPIVIPWRHWIRHRCRCRAAAPSAQCRRVTPNWNVSCVRWLILGYCYCWLAFPQRRCPRDSA